jgi:O-succinylbenzoate synthase
MGRIEKIGENTRASLESRIKSLEEACRTTAQSLATQLTNQIKDFSETLKLFKETQNKHGQRLRDLE